MRQPDQPVRIIYAKLTSTGAYDVVACTPNLELTPARTLAERLVPGNVPHGVAFEQELAYLRPAEGGHLVVRFAPYAWREERGEVYLTDVVWLNDADFARARCNAFAVAPREAGVYETRVELPPLVLAERTEDEDFARLAELMARPGEVARLMAGVLAAGPALAVESGDRLQLLELFTLLLPPAARPLLTFQSRAFRVPHYPPRITLTDRMYGTLEGGPWAAVLPDPSLDVPQGLADELVQAARDLPAFREAHALYQRFATSPSDLKAELLRLLALHRFARALAAQDWGEALRLAASASAPVSGALLGEVLAQAPREVVLDAVLARPGGVPEPALCTPVLLRLAAVDDAAGALRLVDAAPVEVAGGLAQAGALPENRTGALLGAARRAVARDRGFGAALELVRATTALAPVLAAEPSHRQLVHVVRELLRHALAPVRATVDQLHALLALQRECDVLLDASPALAAALPELHTDRQLAARVAPAGGQVALSDDLRVLVPAALLLRARSEPEPAPRTRQTEAASRLLAEAAREPRELVRRLLGEAGVRDEDLLELPAGESLLQLFGASAQRTTLLRDLVRGAEQLGSDEAALGRLAVAVVRARRAQVVLESAAAAPVPELAAALGALPAGSAGDVLAEAALDLLAEVSSRAAFDALEAAALGARSQTVRLRRLDRALGTVESAEQDRIYEALAHALEQGGAGLDPAARKRLRRALGSGSLGRRVARIFGDVMEQTSA